MRLFWMAWGFAVLLVLAAIGGTAWIFAASDQWTDAPRLAVRVVCVVASLAAFVGAFRLALLATASLRLVLAQNLAALIVMELDDLRQAALERASVLADAGGTGQPQPEVWRSSEALRVPGFFGDRQEIRKLLGPATEKTLEQVLESLQSYNQTVTEIRSRDPDQNAGTRLWHDIALVQERIKLAAREVAPFCLAN